MRTEVSQYNMLIGILGKNTRASSLDRIDELMLHMTELQELEVESQYKMQNKCRSNIRPDAYTYYLGIESFGKMIQRKRILKN